MSACADTRPLIGGHVLGGLDDGDVRILLAHLAECPACTAVYERQLELVRLIDAAGPSALRLPSAMEERVLNRLAVVEPERVVTPARRWWTGRERWVAVGAACALGLAASAALLLRDEAGPANATIRLAPTSAGEGAVATVTLIREGSGATFAVEASKLPPPGSGERYILWLTDGNDSRSLGPIAVNARGWGTAVLRAPKRPGPGASIQVSVVSATGGGYRTIAEGRLPS